jgi:hypothetical protein
MGDLMLLLPVRLAVHRSKHAELKRIISMLVHSPVFVRKHNRLRLPFNGIERIVTIS